MITFKQHLSESLSSSYPITVLRSDDLKHTFQFSDGISLYYAEFGRHNVYQRDTIVLHVDFMTQTDAGQYTSQPTGKAANALKVYSTIGAQIKSYIAKHPVEMVYFSAAADATTGVYERLGKRIAAQLGGTYERRTSRSFYVHLSS